MTIQEQAMEWSGVDPETYIFKMLIYGRSGTGKTRFCGSWPKPLFLDLEGGMGSVNHSGVGRLPGDPRRKLDDFKMLVKYMDDIEAEIKQGTFPYQTVVLDSLNALQSVIMEYVLDNFEIKRFYDSLPGMSDYGKMLRDFYSTVERILSWPVNSLFTAVETPREYESDRVSPALIGKKTSLIIEQLMSQVAHTDTVKKEGETLYVIGMNSTDGYVAKDRFSLTTKLIPNDYKFIERLVQEKIKVKGNNNG